MKLFRRRSRSLPPHLEAIRKVPLFEDLSPRDLQVLEPIVHQRKYVAGEMIFEQGQEGLGMYILVEGRVRISRADQNREHEIAVLGAGDFFGELALLDGAPRTATARAESNTSLVGFFRPEFLEILETHGRISAKISLSLARLTGARLRQAMSGHPNCTSL